MAGLAGGVQELTITDSIHICHTQVPKSIILQIFQYFDKETLRSAGLVSKTFHELSKHPSLWTNAVYSGPHSQLPELLKAIPYPPPAVLQTSLPTQTTVTPVPQFSTIIPESTRIMLPVLPETVPLIAQVPDVVATNQQENDKEIVEISQVLPGYARSYAVDYVPNEVNNHSFSTFANTISFNISRYPTPVEITDSKNYRGPDKSGQNSGKPRGLENGVRRTEVAEAVSASVTTVGDSNIEYVPAEYFRGVDTHQVAQSVSVSKAVTFVKPEVLASGRILTHMTPLPSASTMTSTATETIICSQLVDSDDRNKPRDPSTAGRENGDNHAN